MHALALLVPAAAVDAVSDTLTDDWDALSVSIVDADAGTAAEEPVFDEPGTASSRHWKRAGIEALFADEPAATAAATALVASGEAAATIAVVSIGPVDELDWVRLTQAQFAAIEVAPGFWIVPTWADVPAGARHVIRLDPGMAFGTGTHPTTRMCLRWLSETRERRGEAWPRVLDYGCGSGILAIAAAALGARDVDAVDIDAAAVAASEANARANGVRMRTGGARLASGRYDLVIANILATPLKLLAPLLAAHLERGATLLLSGILERQVEEMRDAYAPWLPLAVAARDDGWALLEGTLPSTTPMA